MISLSSLSYDPIGHIQFRPLPSSKMNRIERRVNRVKTLDGGVSVRDTGHWSGDRTFVVEWAVKSEFDEMLAKRLVAMHSQLRLANREGVFVGAPQDIEFENRRARLTFLVIRQEG